MQQYMLETLRFSDLLSKYTGISKTKIDAFIKINPINNIFDHPTAMNLTQAQLAKIDELKEMLSLYKNLKQGITQYQLNSLSAAGEYFKTFFHNQKDKERFVCAFLDNHNNIIVTKVMNTGTVNESPVYPREIIKEALLNDSAAVMLAHNHPGGSLNPSSADRRLTDQIVKAMESVNIKVLDHIVVADGKYYSFGENGDISYTNSNISSVFEAINKQYNNSFPAIKNISEKTANTIYQLNEESGKTLSIAEIKEMYKTAGKSYEATGSAKDMNEFNVIKAVVEDLNHAKALYKNDQVKKETIKSIDLER